MDTECVECQGDLRPDDEANICQECYDADEAARHTEIEEAYIKQGYGTEISDMFDHEFWEGEVFPERFKETV